MRRKRLFLCVTFARADADTRERLRDMLTAPAVPIADVKAIVVRTGLAGTVERLDVYAARARCAIERTTLGGETQAFFLEMIARATQLGALGSYRKAS